MSETDCLHRDPPSYGRAICQFFLPASLLLVVAQAHAGLIAHYTFNETSGTTAADSSGSGNTGTLTNMSGTEWTTGKVGGALDFDGTNDYVSIVENGSLNPTSAFTISAWVKTTGNAQFVVNKMKHNSGVGSDDVYAMRIQTNVVAVQVSDGSSSIWVPGSIVVNDGQWHHLTYVFDKPTSYLYVDGVYDSGGTYPTMNSNVHNTSEGFFIGGANDNGVMDHFFTGTMDDVRIYDNALSAGEVSALAAGSSTAPEPASVFASLGLLSAAGCGLREWRRRKKKA